MESKEFDDNIEFDPNEILAAASDENLTTPGVLKTEEKINSDNKENTITPVLNNQTEEVVISVDPLLNVSSKETLPEITNNEEKEEQIEEVVLSIDSLFNEEALPEITNNEEKQIKEEIIPVDPLFNISTEEVLPEIIDDKEKQETIKKDIIPVDPMLNAPIEEMFNNNVSSEQQMFDIIEEKLADDQIRTIITINTSDDISSKRNVNIDDKTFNFEDPNKFDFEILPKIYEKFISRDTETITDEDDIQLGRYIISNDKNDTLYMLGMFPNVIANLHNVESVKKENNVKNSNITNDNPVIKKTNDFKFNKYGFISGVSIGMVVGVSIVLIIIILMILGIIKI